MINLMGKKVLAFLRSFFVYLVLWDICEHNHPDMAWPKYKLCMFVRLNNKQKQKHQIRCSTIPLVFYCEHIKRTLTVLNILLIGSFIKKKEHNTKFASCINVVICA